MKNVQQELFLAQFYLMDLIYNREDNDYEVRDQFIIYIYIRIWVKSIDHAKRWIGLIYFHILVLYYYTGDWGASIYRTRLWKCLQNLSRWAMSIGLLIAITIMYGYYGYGLGNGNCNAFITMTHITYICIQGL